MKGCIDMVFHGSRSFSETVNYRNWERPDSACEFFKSHTFRIGFDKMRDHKLAHEQALIIRAPAHIADRGRLTHRDMAGLLEDFGTYRFPDEIIAGFLQKERRRRHAAHRNPDLFDDPVRRGLAAKTAANSRDIERGALG